METIQIYRLIFSRFACVDNYANHTRNIVGEKKFLDNEVVFVPLVSGYKDDELSNEQSITYMINILRSVVWAVLKQKHFTNSGLVKREACH